MARPSITAAQLHRFLAERYPGASAPAIIDAGQHSLAAAFDTADGQELILRVAHERGGYDRDQFISQLAAGKLAVPETLQIGAAGTGLFYAVTRRAEGRHHTGLIDQTLMDALDRVHELDISATSGWGSFDAHGRAPHSTWPDALRTMIPSDEELACTESWWDPSLARRLADALADAAADAHAAPRRLVHADFGWRNLLVDDAGVTAVLDWDFSLYGDPLYDVALIDFWACNSSRAFSAAWAERHGRTLRDLAARLRACELAVACGMASYIAKTGDQGTFEQELAAAARAQFA